MADDENTSDTIDEENKSSSPKPVTTRRSYTADRKKKIIAYAEQHGNRAAEREFNVCESNIRKWRKNKAIIEIMPRTKRALTSGKVRWPQLEERLVQEFRRRKLSHVRPKEVQERAMELARDVFHIDDFSGNNSWVFRFLRRHGFNGMLGKKRSNNEIQIRKLMQEAKRTDFDHMYYRITPDSVLLAA